MTEVYWGNTPMIYTKFSIVQQMDPLHLYGWKPLDIAIENDLWLELEGIRECVRQGHLIYEVHSPVPPYSWFWTMAHGRPSSEARVDIEVKSGQPAWDHIKKLDAFVRAVHKFEAMPVRGSRGLGEVGGAN